MLAGRQILDIQNKPLTIDMSDEDLDGS